MSNQQNRSPFQQNSRSMPGNSQRSPQIKKFNSCPAWGSGAVQGFSPSSYNLTSPPSFNSGQSPSFNNGQSPSLNSGHSPSHNFTSPPPHFRPPRNQLKSPRGHPQFRPQNYNNYGQFRTPQPMNRFPTSPQKSWSCDRNFRPMSKRLDLKSPRRNPNFNPGGSNDIEQYYHPAMLADPWQKLTPVPVTQTPTFTT